VKIIDSILFFEDLKTENTIKKEIKVYHDFIVLLKNLQYRSFDASELFKIESELKILDLKADTNRKVLCKKLAIFLKFLEEEFSLIPKNHYTDIYMIIGMCSGMIFSLYIDAINLLIGMLIGMVIGLTVGVTKDKKARYRNLVLHKESN